jgi:hypothetical protein
MHRADLDTIKKLRNEVVVDLGLVALTLHAAVTRALPRRLRWLRGLELRAGVDMAVTPHMPRQATAAVGAHEEGRESVGPLGRDCWDAG